MKHNSTASRLLALILVCQLLPIILRAQPMMKQAIHSVKNSVVQIICSDFDTRGSGFLAHEDGYVLTNHHVVCQYVLENNILRQTNYSKSIKVRFDDGSEFQAKIAFTRNLAEDRRPLLYDYAILKIEGPNFASVAFADYDSTDEGSEVFFCGFPLSSQHLTTHKGMVSAKYVREGTFNRTPQKVFQIDGSINKGNSGGPLFDLTTGKVIGIISTREGGISKDLDELRTFIVTQKKQSSGGVFIQGVDPLPVIVELTNTLDKFISVGIGHAISIEYPLAHLHELLGK